MQSKKDIQRIKKYAKSLIKKNDINDALEQLEELVRFNKKANNDFIIISSSYYDIKRNENLGILDREFINRQKALIAKNLLEFIDDLNESDFNSILENSEIVKKLRSDLELKKVEIQEQNNTIIHLHKLISQKDNEINDIINQFNRFKKEKSLEENISFKELSVQEIINKGEGQMIEFKSTINKSNTQKILQTMIAFMNSKGGIILAGISDSKEILGLESITSQKLDKIKMNLLYKLNNAVGKEFSQLIIFDTYKINDKVILGITCLASTNPVFYKDYKSKTSCESFFIRIEGTVRRITSIADIILYTDSRFKNNGS